MSAQDKQLVSKATLSYEEMQQLATHQDIAIRCQLAERQDLKPEILYFLAEDKEMEVRRRIALNPTTPRQADLLLAKDKDENVRLELTEKISKLAPDVSVAERTKIQTLTYDTLHALSRDQATKVRQILSETLKDFAQAPNDIIKHLAKDMEVVVAGPVLQFSPVLSDDDLLEIISSTHAKGALNAISKRENVSESVSDAVVATNEETAIADLLANDSAQIREDTLDMLAEQAHNITAWHAPLVRRPKLSEKAATRMAHYLAENLLSTLQERNDLPVDVIDAVKQEVKKRIDGDDSEEETDPIEEIKALQEKGELTEEMVEQWIDGSKHIYAQSALAVLADLTRVKVKKVLASQSGKAIMALAWKAALPAAMGEKIQINLAKMPIQNVLKADENGAYPLNGDELSWQLELFGDG